RIVRFTPVNFLNPERKVLETSPGTGLAWPSVPTGNLAGADVCLDEPRRRPCRLRTKVASAEGDLAALAATVSSCHAAVLLRRRGWRARPAGGRGAAPPAPRPGRDSPRH